MKRKLILILVFIGGITSLVAQIPYPELIKAIKPTIIAIEAHDDTLITQTDGKKKKFKQYGSGVVVKTDPISTYVITNEHVIAIKDTNRKTVRYAKNIFISVNLKNGGTYSCKGEIYKIDEKLDLVALKIMIPRNMRDSLKILGINKVDWENESNLKEGEIVLYSGFPLKMGRGKINFPLTRTGIISQLIPNNQTFLIDAFVQPGYSGSPVFVLRADNKVLPVKWDFKFIGICQAYPYITSPIFKKVKSSEIPNVYFKENPGFSIVIGVSALKQLFNK